MIEEYLFKVYKGNTYKEVIKFFDSDDEAKNYAKFLLNKYIGNSVKIEKATKTYFHVDEISR